MVGRKATTIGLQRESETTERVCMSAGTQAGKGRASGLESQAKELSWNIHFKVNLLELAFFKYHCAIE